MAPLLQLTGGYLRRCASPWEQTRGIKRGFAGERNVGEARGPAARTRSP